MAFVTRYADDPSRPSPGGALRDLAVRTVAPAVVLFAAVVVVGKVIEGPLRNLGAHEESFNATLASHRTALWNTITTVWSHIGNTEYVIGACVVVVALVWWRTKEWWYAVIPAIAVTVQAAVFVPATALVNRPRPHVPHLDPAPPTSSYPSGHVGASTALYWTLALMAQRIENRALRVVVTLVCAVIPPLVAYSRLYRGMHHLSDVIVGFLNGLVCLLLAWHYLRRRAGRHTLV